MTKPGQFAGGALLGSEKSGEVSVVGEENPVRPIFAGHFGSVVDFGSAFWTV